MTKKTLKVLKELFGVAGVFSVIVGSFEFHTGLGLIVLGLIFFLMSYHAEETLKKLEGGK